MKIEIKKYEKILNTSNGLLTFSIILYSITTLLFFLAIIFQKNLITFPLSYEVSSIQFIFPTIIVIRFLVCFGFFLFFAIAIKNKDVKNNHNISFEIFAFVTMILLNTVFNTIIYYVAYNAAHEISWDYYIWFSELNSILTYTTYLIPFALLAFYIGITIKMVISVLNPIEIDNSIE